MEHYRVVKTTMGRKFWVKMDKEEVRAQRIYRALVVGMPLFMLTVFAWAAGIIR